MSVGRESSSASERPMLVEPAGLTNRFGELTAVTAVDLPVDAPTTLGLIGPNGAGKTTLINLISGVLTADEGAIRFAGADISREPAHRLAARGIARTFQGVRVFKGLSVLDNVLIGAHTRLRQDVLLRLAPTRGRTDPADALALLERVGLARARAGALAGELPYGDQRRLEIARALASRPRPLLPDEPAAGMNPAGALAPGALLRAPVPDGPPLHPPEHHPR